MAALRKGALSTWQSVHPELSSLSFVPFLWERKQHARSFKQAPNNQRRLLCVTIHFRCKYNCPQLESAPGFPF